MNNEIKLRQRFCKDCDIPINVFDEPYFSDRLKLFDFLYDSVSKWKLFTKEFKKYDSCDDYFTNYSRIKDEAIAFVRNTEGFQIFTAYGINDFSIKNKLIVDGDEYYEYKYDDKKDEIILDKINSDKKIVIKDVFGK